MAEGVCVDRTLLGDSDSKLILSVELERCQNPPRGFFIFKDKGVSGGVECGRQHEDEESISSEEENCRKKRCSERYDSSESSDSGVAVHCGDCGSSNSDITEPCSPLSTTSLEEMPPTQSQPAWLWESKRPKQGKITEYFKTKGKKGGSKLLSPPPPIVLYDEKSVSSDSGLGLHRHHQETTTSSSSSSSSSSSTESSGASPVFLEPSPPEPPRTIRFPPKNGWKGHYVSDIVCRWTACEAKFNTTSALIEHLQVSHVNSQTLGEYYICQWVECKVFERKSCSRTWLERHVLSHGGNKPYRCIVDGCGQRFSSQTLLQRHVNNHFTEGNQQGSSKKNCESTSKLIRRNGKKLRYRRHPFSARIYDYFDAGIMEGLQHNLIQLTERRTLGQIDTTPGHTVTLHSKVLCKRIDNEGNTKVLLRWFPLNVVCDEWVELSEGVERTREVNIPSLPSQTKDWLYQLLTDRSSPGRPTRKTTNTAATT